MLGVHEMCNRESQGIETILKSGKLGIYVYMHIVQYAKRFRGIREELKVLEGTLLEGGQEEGRSKYGQNHIKVGSLKSPL